MNNMDDKPTDGTDQRYYNKLQLLRQILNKVKMQKRENRSKLRASNVPVFNPKKIYNMQQQNQAREQKQTQFSIGDGKFISDKTLVKKTFVGYKQSREQRSSILDEIEKNIVPEDQLPILEDEEPNDQSYKRQKLDAEEEESAEISQEDHSEHENGEDGSSTP